MAASTIRSVWRQRRAGIWRTSSTRAAFSTWLVSWTSERTGTPTSCLMASRISIPFSSPGPLNEDNDERLALSYEALKIKGIPSSWQISFISLAIKVAWSWLSMTHGPPMRKRGWVPPMLTFSFTFISLTTVGIACSNKGFKKGMRVQWLGLEFRVELTA